MRTLLLTPLLAALVLAGCATAPTALPETPIPAAWKAAPAEGQWQPATPAAAAQPRGAWWQAFADPVLDGLAVRVTAHTQLAEAAARLAEARALARNADAVRAPQLGLAAGASRGAGADRTGSTQPATAYTAGVQLAWEADLSGRLARGADAAALDAQAQAALLESTRLLLQAELAQTYLALRAADAERALVRGTEAAWRDALALTERRFAAGDVAELDLTRLQAELAATQADAIALDRRRGLLEHALAVLVGEPAPQFALPALQVPALMAPPTIPAGVPATLLQRRPDIAAAQLGVQAAQQRVGVAQAAWFPDLQLTAAGGFASPRIGDVLQWSARSWGIGLLASLPLFDGGRREAGVQAASAQLDASLARYRGSVLGALREVEDQLVSLRTLGEQAQVQARGVAAAERATQLSTVRWRNGLVSQIELLDARRSELAQRRAALAVQAQQQQATVALVRALGGGWSDS